MTLPKFPQEGFYGTAITEIQVTHSSAVVPVAVPSSASIKRTHGSAVSHVSFEDDAPPPNPSGTQTYFSSVTSAAPTKTQPSPTPLGRSKKALKKTVGTFVVEDPIKRAYLRTSFLFALSVLVTWIPSSLNRIHSWLQGESPFEYHVATAAVLPLQGLWNAVIFFVTSWAPLKERVRDMCSSSGTRFRRGSGVEDEAEFDSGVQQQQQRRRGGRDPRPFDSDLDDDDDGNSGVVGSEVELRCMAEGPGKRSESL